MIIYAISNETKKNLSLQLYFFFVAKCNYDLNNFDNIRILSPCIADTTKLNNCLRRVMSSAMVWFYLKF